MKKCYLLALAVSAYTITEAQLPSDALRNSWYTPLGSARSVSVGGALGALGGDISSNHTNPAGLGFYRTREAVITAGVLNSIADGQYRWDSVTRVEKKVFNYGTIGVVIGEGGYAPKWKSEAVALTLNQTASFNNHIRYRGLNNFSSFSEQYVEELTRDAADVLAAERNYIYGSSLAFRTYLVDSTHDANGVFNGYRSLVPLGSQGNPYDGLRQYRDEQTFGGIHELALGYGANTNDKLFIGGSLNIPIISFRRELFYKEEDASGKTDNDFNYFEFRETFRSFGIGLGVKLGAIYKPVEYLRLGLAFHTPQIISFKDQVRASMTTDTEGYAGVLSESSDNLNNGAAGKREYRLLTPWKAILSAAYVFRETQNTSKQRAFLTADVEYVNHRGSRFFTISEEDVAGKELYRTVNNAVKAFNKGNFNFRVGGELKFDPVMFRVGAAYYGSPYKSKDLDASRTVLSGGIGFRKYGMFIDLTYQHTIVKDVSFPYMLNDVANTFATIRNTRGVALVTFGFKF